MEEMQQAWKEMYSKTLPAAAKARSKAQPVWPVSLDHCFARIILDNSVGVDSPWTSKLKSPAYKNMSEDQLRNATTMGQDILDGKKSLDELNRRSLDLREKKGPKRARASADKPNNDEKKSKKFKREEVKSEEKPKDEKQESSGIDDTKAEEGTKVGSQELTEHELNENGTVSKDVNDKFDISILDKTPDLTPFRRKVLALLYTVPKGQWTTYKAMSDALSSSPRAVGNAMRNNPYAPMVPCHRVLASDGNIGGFGGEWGSDGKHASEKIKLLRQEGVRFDGKGKVVGRAYTFPAK